jgi:hypothetical protein
MRELSGNGFKQKDKHTHLGHLTQKYFCLKPLPDNSRMEHPQNKKNKRIVVKEVRPLRKCIKCYKLNKLVKDLKKRSKTRRKQIDLQLLNFIINSIGTPK